MAEKTQTIKVGSRKSELALIQTDAIIEALKALHPDTEFEIEKISTKGDKILDVALSKIGDKGLFTKELEVALYDGRVDFVVHSLKDLPTTLPPGLGIGAIFKREEKEDAVIFHPKFGSSEMSLAKLPEGSVIGSSSLRRVAQLRKLHPHLKFETVRGNLNTRLRKLDNDNKYDALILAVAGIKRMKWGNRIGQVLDPEECLYAVGQGALGVEVRAEDQRILSLVSEISDLETVIACSAERSFLKSMGGGCDVPIGVNSSLKEDKLSLTGGVFSLDGSQSLQDSLTVNISSQESSNSPVFGSTNTGILARQDLLQALKQAESLGETLGANLLERGGKEIVETARSQAKSRTESAS